MSKASSKAAQTDESITIEFLRENPDILMSYPEIFASMADRKSVV